MKFKRGIVLFLGVLILLTGCGAKDEKDMVDALSIVNLKAIYLGKQPQKGLDELYEQLDQITINELGCTIRFDFIPWGNEREQLNLATASGEYDFIPGGVFSDYRNLISKNAFLNLNDYLYLTPDLVQHYQTYSKNALEFCKIDGALYGLPQFSAGEIENINEGFFYREDLRKEWGLEKISDLDTLEKYLYRAKKEERYANEPLITDNRIWQSLWFMITKGKYLEVISIQESPYVVVACDEPDKILNRFELSEFKEVLEYIQKWRADGILDSDLISASNNEGMRAKQMLLNDEKPCETNVPIWSITSSYIPELSKVNEEWEYDFFPYLTVNEAWYMGSLEEASVISISSKTTHPEVAIKLLEKIHTDQKYYNLFKYGVEGINYKIEDNKITREGIASDCFFGWTVCSDDLLSLEEKSTNEKWETTVDNINQWREELISISEDNPLNGFHFVTAEISSEITGMNAVLQQYFLPLACGYSNNLDYDLNNMNNILRKAGLTKYMQRMQKQLDER